MKATTLVLALTCLGCAADVRETAHPAELSSSAAVADPTSPERAEMTDELTIVPHPSWTCGLPNGIAPPQRGTPAFTAEIEVKSARDLGRTQYGRRQLIELGAGQFSGPGLEATLAPGGIELPLTLPNGTVELEQILVLRGTRGEHMYLRVCGVAANTTDPVRVVMDFEAANDGPYAAINKATLVGTRTLSADGKTLTLTVSDVTGVALPEGQRRIEKLPDFPQQRWDCKKQPGKKRGPVLFRETVGIGPQLAVGPGKRGNRVIIPITGGTATGRISGKVLPLGGDFPLFGATIEIDARYAIETDDGELVLVRNCGPFGRLVPTFEASATGSYAFLNDGEWLSSDPGIGLGVVNLTMFEAI